MTLQTKVLVGNLFFVCCLTDLDPISARSSALNSGIGLPGGPRFPSSCALEIGGVYLEPRAPFGGADKVFLIGYGWDLFTFSLRNHWARLRRSLQTRASDVSPRRPAKNNTVVSVFLLKSRALMSSTPTGTIARFHIRIDCIASGICRETFSFLDFLRVGATIKFILGIL